MVKFILQSLFFLFLISSSNILVASQGAQIPEYFPIQYRGKIIDEKVYLHPGMAQICPNGIVVQVNGELVPVPAIESDMYGVFVQLQYLEWKVKASDWLCTTCWNWNSYDRKTCSWCGADKEEDKKK